MRSADHGCVRACRITYLRSFHLRTDRNGERETRKDKIS